MKIGIVISQVEHEIVWNALRFAVFSLKNSHEVRVFLLGKGVEIEGIEDEKFDVKEQLKQFISNKGKMYTCGSCLIIRDMQSTETCPISTMQDLLSIIENSDKILTF